MSIEILKTEKKGPKDDFVQTLEQSGFRTVKTLENEGKVTIEVPQGRFHLKAGFPEFDPNDRRFFYGNNVVEMQHKPLELDFNSPVFVKLAEEFRRKANPEQSVDEIMTNLDDLVQEAVQSDSADERIERMSQILQKGRSACTGKVLVSAGLLKTGIVNPEVQLVYGASSSFEDKRPHNIGHIWLRVGFGNNVVLYDPYFGHMIPYNLSDPSTIEDDPFDKYSVGAYFAANVINQLPVKSLDRKYVKLVTETSGNKSAWVANDRSLSSQVFGEMDFEFETKASGQLTFVNGGLFSARGGGAGFNYPLKKMAKV